MWRAAVSVLTALLFACAVPGVARAQTIINGTTLDAWVDGKGALQAQVADAAGSEFDPVGEYPARAGLEIVAGTTYSPLGDATRVNLSGPTLQGTSATSSYRAAGLEITEKASVTNGSYDLALEYTIVNPGPAAVTGRAAVLGAVGREAKGVTPDGTFAGVRDHLGRRVGLVKDTPWQHYEVGAQAFADFAAAGLADTVAGGFARQAVGAQWELNLAGNGGQQVIRVLWRFDRGVTHLAVNTVQDTDDGVCDSAHCSLYEAVAYAEDDGEIALPAGRYQLTRELKSRRSDVTLTGQDARSTIIDGGNATRLLNVLGGQLSVARITFTGGNGDPNDQEKPFAAAFAPGSGGAILVQQGALLELSEVAVVDNAALGANQVGGGVAGGGEIDIDRSLIARNRAAAGGGGIAIQEADSSELDVSNSTISDNTAGGDGGGVYAGAFTSLNSVTLADNQADGQGGGLYRGTTASTVVRNTLLAGNRRGPAAEPVPSACGGTAPSSTEFSLADDATCELDSQGDHQNDANARRLGTLANNGGPTDTRALQAGNPAIDAGSACPSVDQRGVDRYDDDDACDIGAYEVIPAPPAPAAHIFGRPLSIATDGLGQIQVQANEDPRGAFRQSTGAQQNLPSEVADAGLAFMVGDTYFPAGGPSGYPTVGTRTPVNPPVVTSSSDGRRRVESVYDIGDKLNVSEIVTYADGDQSGTFDYVIHNPTGAAVDYRAAQIATLGAPASGARVGQSIVTTTATGAQLTLTNLGQAWSAWQMGKASADSDVYAAFTTGGGLEDSLAEPGLGNTQIAAEWRTTIGPNDSRFIKVAWRLDPPPTTYAVTTTSDHAPDGCTAADCTLREALAAPGNDAVVALPAGAYQLTDELTVTNYRVIRGAGARQTTLNAAADRRLFLVEQTGSLGLSGVTLTGGDARRATTAGGFGGAIVASGQLAVTDSAVTGNTATAAGAIYAAGGKLTITRTTIAGNRALETADDDNGVVGGVYAVLGVLEVVNSTFSANTADGLVGALAAFSRGTVVNSTFTNNTATAASGVYLQGFGGEGGTASAVSMYGSIVAGNRGSTQCAVTALRSDDNIGGDASCAFTGPGDRIIADPKLGPLANNGGPTDTHYPLADSPAIEGGGYRQCATTDQRGLVLRPYSGLCDNGSVEVGVLPPEAPTLDVPQVNGASVTLTGRAGARTASVELFVDGQSVGRRELGPGEPASYTIPQLPDGEHRFYVIAYDADNLASAPSVTRTVRIDTTPPATPQITTADAQQLTGTAEPGSQVTIYEGEKALGVVTAGGDGSWTFPLGEVAPGEHVYTAVARDGAGNASGSSSPQSVTVAQVAQQTPAPAPSATPAPTASPVATPTPTPLPEPETGKSVNVEVDTGKVLIRLPGSKGFLELKAGEQIPVGTTVDTTKGRVTLSSTGPGGKVETADFYDGIFKVTQTKGAKPVTVLTLTEPLSCPKKGRAATAAAKKKKVRRLWGSGKGSFRTDGKYSAATVRGTTWLTQDSCTTTLTRVTQGVVEVRDRVKRKTVLIKAGKRYTARARGR